jgi:hypothetical protein
MSGMEPMLIGAMLGGGVSAARGGNPLKGALLGAVGGGIGGAALNAGNVAATAQMTGATMPAVGTGVSAGAALPAAGTATAAQAANIAANPALSFGAANTAAGSTMVNPGIFATATQPVYAATGGSTGLIPSITAPATLMDQLGAAAKFSKENPFQMNLASNIMQQNAQEDAQRLAEMRARSGLISGKQIPQSQPVSSFGVPQISLI